MKSSVLVIATLAITLLIAVVTAETYLHERFESYPGAWVTGTNTGKTLGEFKLTSGKFGSDKGIQTSQDARHYTITRNFDKEFSNRDQDLVIQLSVKNEQGIDCGGQYVKVGSTPDLEKLENMKDDTKYAIMFGPDICGGNRKVHFIFNYNGKNLDWKKTVQPATDKLTHVYTAIVHPDNTYKMLIDGEVKESGSLEEDWDFLPPKRIEDPDEKKPEDWVDEAKMVDPEDAKPEDWDDEPKLIPDAEATQPEDWDEEEDGEWEAPQVPNPKYKGEWTPRMIDNPNYKGVWKAQMIDNPDYTEDKTLYEYEKLNWVAIEIWMVKSGTIFDNIMVTDSVEEAAQAREQIKKAQEDEKDEHDAAEKQKKEEEAAEAAKRQEEEAAKRAEEEAAKEQEEAQRKEAEERMRAQEDAEMGQEEEAHEDL